MEITASIDISATQRQILLDLLGKHLVNTQVWAFGSRVKWTTRSNSDLDLVVFSSPEQSSQVSALKEALEESNLPFRVDLLVWDKLPENFQRNIEESYVVLVGGDDVEQVEFMGSKWSLISIDKIKAESRSAISIGPFGSNMKSDCYVNEGIPVIRGTNIAAGPTFKGEFVYITEELADRLRSSNVYQYDLVFPHRGSIGEVGIILDNTRYVISSSLMKLTCDRSKVSPKFLYYFFKSSLGRHELLKNASQVGTPGIGQPLASLKSIEFRLPPLEIQNQIESILTSLDDKIELNHQLNKTLEQIAQALFKSWFVDFEPVKAKIAAKQAGANAEQIEQAALCAISGKTPEQLAQLNPQILQQLKTTAALFPDALVDSELGEIPEGWEIVRFKQIVEKYIDNRGKTPPIVDSGIPLLEVKHLPDHSIKPNVNTDKFVNDETYKTWFRAHLNSEDLIISTVGTIGRLCMVPKGIKIAIAQNLLGLRFDRAFTSPYFMYFLMDGKRFRDDVNNRLVITVQASIKRQDLETIDLLSPPITLQNKFESFVKPFVEMQQSDETFKLSQLRDSLLPKLLSGELL
ncbi:MAG: restriction endonuclease subunit S [Methylococcales bacterium]|nr:restriction endonuclease subunit S [Methylococcales bacterium]